VAKLLVCLLLVPAAKNRLARKDHRHRLYCQALASEGDRTLITYPDSVLDANAEIVAIDPAVADSEYHPCLDLLYLFLAVNYGMATWDRRFLMLKPDPVKDRKEKGAAKLCSSNTRAMVESMLIRGEPGKAAAIPAS
jgi:hypothetical protein